MSSPKVPSIEVRSDHDAPFAQALMNETLIELRVADLAPIGAPGISNEPVLDFALEPMSHDQYLVAAELPRALKPAEHSAATLDDRRHHPEVDSNRYRRVGHQDRHHLAPEDEPLAELHPD